MVGCIGLILVILGLLLIDQFVAAFLILAIVLICFLYLIAEVYFGEF